jgi:hypothetical protein
MELAVIEFHAMLSDVTSNVLTDFSFSSSFISEGKAMATAYDCKFIETSVGINHNVVSMMFCWPK